MTAASGRGGRGRALVTGASAGIGAAFAERLARDGYDLVVVARRRDRLTQLAQRVHDCYGVAAEVLVADLARPADVLTVEERVARDQELEMVVNNAGFGMAAPFSRADPDAIEAMIHVHVMALVRLTRAALPGMMARGHGSVINVSSTSAFDATPVPRQAVYAATKAFVTTFTQGVHAEVKGTGVHVQALCPGWTRTEILERRGVTSRDLGIPDAAFMMPDVLVDASLKGLELGEVVCVPSLHDAGLVDQIMALQRTAFEAAEATGIPAQRYTGTG